MAPADGVKVANQEEARRLFRQELLEQKHNLQRNKEVLCDISTNRLDEAVRRLDCVREQGEALGEGFQRSKDVSAQAEILRTLAGYGVEATNKLVQQQQGRGPVELVRAFRAAFVHTSDPQRDGEEDPMAFCWSELAAATEHLRRPARGMHCMLGPLDVQTKERKAPAQRQKRQALGQVERPVEMEAIVDDEKQETDRNMEVMWQIIKAQPEELVPVAELVLNHASFAQTLENLFTLAFLVRDSRVAVQWDSTSAGRGLMVRTVDGKKVSGKQDGPQQFVYSFHMDDWDMMRKYVSPAKCLMPHREGVEAGEAMKGKKPTQPAQKKQRQA